MPMVEKGIIIDFGKETDDYGNVIQARIQPLERPENQTCLLTIPWYYRGETGKLESGNEVAYVVFDDNTGIIISRMDGNWTGSLKGKKIELVEEGNFKGKNIELIDGGKLKCNGDIECNGNIGCNDLISRPDIIDVSFNSHWHQVKSTPSASGAPNKIV